MTTKESLYLRLDELASELDHDFTVEISEMYVKDAPLQIKAIAEAMRGKNSDALIQSAHKLKGSSLNIGAVSIGSMCLRLEQLGKSGMPFEEAGDIQDLKTEFDIVKTLLEAYIKKEGS
ncbi:MAG: Hpt domain-containing protein [Bacteroidota bacterium]